MSFFRWYCLFTTACLSIVCPVALIARQQPPPYFDRHYVTHYDDSSGLFSNDITGFFEDLNGYFWFTTQNGLVKFDGRHFRHFDKDNVSGLTSNRFYSLNSDAKDHVYFADEKAGVHKIDSSGQLSSVPGLKARHNFLMSRHGYLFDMRPYLKTTEDSTRIIKELRATKHDLAMHEFYPDAAGNAWFLSAHDISYFKQGHFEPVDNYDRDVNAHFYIGNTLFAVDPDGNIRAYTAGKNTGIPLSLQSILAPFNEKGRPDIRQARFCSNRSGTFLQYHNRLYALDFDGQTVRATLLLQDLSLPLVKDVFYSPRYRIYVFTTSTYGFYLVRQQPFTVRHFKQGMENSFTAAVEIQPGQVLTSNGVLFTKEDARRIYNYDRLLSNTLLKDRQQRVWFMGGDTLFCLNNRLQALQRLVVPGDTYLISLQEDDKGVIWYLTNNGLARIDSGQLRFVYTYYSVFDRAQCLFFFNDTTIWLGTTKGLFAFNKHTRAFTAYPAMKEKYVRHVYRARDGSIWIGTYDDGFYTYRDGHFIALPKDRMNYLKSAHYFMEDDQGFFWIPTNKGLFQVKKAALDEYVVNRNRPVHYYYYDRKDGFASNEFNGGTSPAGIRLHDGTFSLCSMKGLVWFHPQQVKPVLPEGNIYIDRVWIDTQEVKYADTLRFVAGTRKVSFEISSPFFGNRINFMPEYRIAGVDKSWTRVPDDNTIALNYLEAGDYMLEIRLWSGFGEKEYITRTQLFSIAPFFTETLLYKILMIALICVVISVIVVAVANRRKDKQKQRALSTLNQQLQNTVTELRESEENLHQSNLLKDKITSIILHDIRSPLRFINLLSNQLHTGLTTANNQRLMTLTTELKRSTDQLDKFTRELLVWLTTQQAGFKIRREYLYVRELFRETEEFFSGIGFNNHNTFLIEPGEDIGIWIDKQLLRIILHNLIDNANKHTEGGAIRLSAFLQGEELVIKVADTGEGMSLQDLASLQSRLQDTRNVFVTDSGSNLGYRIIRDFVARLNGRIEVESVLKQGTTVTIFFPFPLE